MSKAPKESKTTSAKTADRGKKRTKKVAPKPQPVPETAPAQPASSDDGGGRQAALFAGAAAALFLLVAVVGALVATRFYWEPALVAHARQLLGMEAAPDPLADLRARVAALESVPEQEAAAPAIDTLRAEGARLGENMAGLVGRVNDIDQALRTLRAEVEAGDGAAERDAARADLEALRRNLSQRLDELRAQGDAGRRVDGGRLEALEQDKAALLQRLETVADRLAALEDDVERQASRFTEPSALVLAVSALRRAVESGGGFASELDTVARFASERSDLQPHVSALRTAAPSGVPTLVALQRRFEDLAAGVARTGPGGSGWVDELVDRIGAMVSIRRTDIATGDSPDAILLRAQAHLAAGDLAAAVAELGALPETARGVAQPWLDDAARRLAALESIRALEAALLSGGAAARG